MNYVFLQHTMQLVDGNCVLTPRELAFRTFELPTNMSDKINMTYDSLKDPASQKDAKAIEAATELNDIHAANYTNDTNKTKRQANGAENHPELLVDDDNATILTGEVFTLKCLLYLTQTKTNSQIIY